MKHSLGIIGGMGPLATCDLLEKIISLTDAKTDQEHIHILVDVDTDIPDRTAAILDNGKSPVPEMVASAVRLQKMGAEALLIGCNTAHFFYSEVSSHVNIPILHMLRETAGAAAEMGISRVGLLATDGTIRSGVYGSAFAEKNISVVTPSAHCQPFIMQLIYQGVKAGNYHLPLDGFYAAADELYANGAEILVLGCTELPPAFRLFHIDLEHLDPTVILAKSAIRFAGLDVVS